MRTGIDLAGPPVRILEQTVGLAKITNPDFVTRAMITLIASVSQNFNKINNFYHAIIGVDLALNKIPNCNSRTERAAVVRQCPCAPYWRRMHTMRNLCCTLWVHK